MESRLIIRNSLLTSFYSELSNTQMPRSLRFSTIKICPRFSALSSLWVLFLSVFRTLAVRTSGPLPDGGLVLPGLGVTPAAHYLHLPPLGCYW